MPDTPKFRTGSSHCSKHGTSPSESFQKGSCSHKPSDDCFSYHGILLDPDRPVQRQVEAMVACAFADFHLPVLDLTSPPPKASAARYHLLLFFVA